MKIPNKTRAKVSHIEYLLYSITYYFIALRLYFYIGNQNQTSYKFLLFRIIFQTLLYISLNEQIYLRFFLA